MRMKNEHKWHGKRFLAVLLTLVMLLSVLPVSAMAKGGVEPSEPYIKSEPLKASLTVTKKWADDIKATEAHEKVGIITNGQTQYAEVGEKTDLTFTGLTPNADYTVTEDSTDYEYELFQNGQKIEDGKVKLGELEVTGFSVGEGRVTDCKDVTKPVNMNEGNYLVAVKGQTFLGLDLL